MTSNTFYFTSNRLGGRGKDDIYVAHKLMSQEPLLAVNDEYVPEAINLDELAQANRSDAAIEEISNTDDATAKVVPVSEAESVAILSEEALVDFSDAKLISVTTSPIEAINLDDLAEVFFIQLASLTQSDGKMSNYNSLATYGQLYRFFKSSSVKIRLGFYANRSEAERILRNVKSNGFSDAFITRDILATSNYEILDNSNSSFATDDNGWGNDYNLMGALDTESSYKVKLASYMDPMKFQVDNVLDLGRLEQWTKGKWTIFILGGFETIDDAKQARIKAINRGFVDSELVEDDRGILSRVKEQ